MDRHLDAAIEGYRLLGLGGHAALAERAREHGFDPEAGDDAHWEALDAEWFELPDAELARREYLRAHPGEFGL